ncbi:rha family phage regulatory protein [Bacillus cereus MSX-A1]|uniref:Rha family transcriptional regulator n=1 Tax=Bacillus cereus TaxID=1396 RepID=UPI000279534A|nr:Rha family transcriptional regulator [Bacillus cereus]EJR05096.1 rha family phage regulatory protein [Bacillus cereus MSX-A1]
MTFEEWHEERYENTPSEAFEYLTSYLGRSRAIEIMNVRERSYKKSETIKQNKMMTGEIEMTNTELVFVNNNNEVVTDSLKVAEIFGKRHDNVVADIEKLMGYSSEEFSLLNFQDSKYINERGREYNKYNLTKDGFALLAMGFTGKKAVEFKMKYIEEFNRMEIHIKEQQKPKSALDQIQQLLLEGTMELKQQVDELETFTKEGFGDIQKEFINKMTIDSQQQRIMQNTVEASVRYCWNNGTNHGRFTKRQLFSKAHRRLKDRYGVSSYKDILSKDFEEAVDYMRNWKGE